MGLPNIHGEIINHIKTYAFLKTLYNIALAGKTMHIKYRLKNINDVIVLPQDAERQNT